MSEGKTSATLILTLVGSALAIINGLWIAVEEAPIVLSSFAVGSVDEVLNSKVFWGRIAFGVSGLVENLLVAFWLIFAVGLLLITLHIYIKPRKHKQYAPLIMLFSLLCIPIGGGFYVGTILGFIGGAAAMDWPKSFGQTFFGKMLRGAMLSSKLYSSIRDNPATLKTAAFTVIFVAILSGLGNGLYTYNAYLIDRGAPEASSILLQGQIIWAGPPILTTIAFIGITVLEWLILSLTIYWIGSKLMGMSSEYDKVARLVAFAYVPMSLQLFMPLMFANEPTLSFGWPLSIYLASRLWVFIALAAIVGLVFDIPKGRALGVTILATMIYWLINNVMLAPTLNIPGVLLKLPLPESSLIVLLMTSTATLVATFLGVFSRR